MFLTGSASCLPERDNEPSGDNETSTHENWSVRYSAERDESHHVPGHEKCGDIEPYNAGEWQWCEIEQQAVNKQQDAPDKSCGKTVCSGSFEEADPDG